jgi:hypothetical protein
MPREIVLLQHREVGCCRFRVLKVSDLIDLISFWQQRTEVCMYNDSDASANSMYVFENPKLRESTRCKLCVRTWIIGDVRQTSIKQRIAIFIN